MQALRGRVLPAPAFFCFNLKEVLYMLWYVVWAFFLTLLALGGALYLSALSSWFNPPDDF